MSRSHVPDLGGEESEDESSESQAEEGDEIEDTGGIFGVRFENRSKKKLEQYSIYVILTPPHSLIILNYLNFHFISR